MCTPIANIYWEYVYIKQFTYIIFSFYLLYYLCEAEMIIIISLWTRKLSLKAVM